ncbi:hypothetical protein QCA50_011020 [Cerrena zonata]|uniref:Uncharacterized protein n=1 Tax=Cerrena zonata TaxID=2478898 RepID=A0AAW0FXY4_9APHY
MHDSDKAFASASEWLDRAKGAPLEIIGTIRWGFDSRRVWQLLIPHLDRTFTLSIAFVMIQNIWTSAGHYRSWIPVQKLLDSLPNLRDLEISVQYGATDSWLPHVTNPHLTRLALTGGNKTVQDHETLFKGIAVLQSLPLLEKLELENVYVIRRAREVNRPQSIFTSLRHLTMSGGCRAIATFLKCTNCLQTVHLSINVVNPIYVGFKDSKDILMFGVISFCEILQLIHDTTLQSIVTARIGTECDLASLEFLH